MKHPADLFGFEIEVRIDPSLGLGEKQLRLAGHSAFSLHKYLTGGETERADALNISMLMARGLFATALGSDPKRIWQSRIVKPEFIDVSSAS